MSAINRRSDLVKEINSYDARLDDALESGWTREEIAPIVNTLKALVRRLDVVDYEFDLDFDYAQ